MNKLYLILIYILPLLLGKNFLENPSPLTNKNFTEICDFLKYPVETHKIHTTDGYILTYFRI
jgi:hypothetical protein